MGLVFLSDQNILLHWHDKSGGKIVQEATQESTDEAESLNFSFAILKKSPSSCNNTVAV